MRVTNQYRWRRTKTWVCVATFLAALAFAGGLESADPNEAIPSPLSAITFLAIATALMLNLTKQGGSK